MVIDRTSGVPAYRQVAADIRSKIAAGAFPPGTTIPSERDLVAHYDVSRPTIRDAIGLLRTEGVLVAEHGRGVFVREPVKVIRLARGRLARSARQQNKSAFLADADSAGFTPSTTVEIRFEQATERIAEILGAEEVCVRDRVMSADGVAVMLAVSRLPRSFTRGTQIEETDTGTGGIYARLEESGHKLSHFEEAVSARMPTPEEASALQLTTGTPVIAITRVAYTDEGAAAEVNDMVLAGDRYELIYQFPAD